MEETAPTLLSIVELGGYSSLTPSYARAGYRVVNANAMRQALRLLKRERPRVIVAEFNWQSDFRDRTSSLESLLASVQTRCPEARVIVLYEERHADRLQGLLARLPVYATLAFPIESERVEAVLAGLD